MEDLPRLLVHLLPHVRVLHGHLAASGGPQHRGTWGAAPAARSVPLHARPRIRGAARPNISGVVDRVPAPPRHLHGVFQRAAYRTVRCLPALSVSSPLVAGARAGVRAHLVLRDIADHGAFRHLRASVPAVRRRRPHHQHARCHAWVLGLHSALPLPARSARCGRAVHCARRGAHLVLASPARVWNRHGCHRRRALAVWHRGAGWAVGCKRAIRRAGWFAGRHVRHLHGHPCHHARPDDRPYGVAAARCAPRWLERAQLAVHRALRPSVLGVSLAAQLGECSVPNRGSYAPCRGGRGLYRGDRDRDRAGKRLPVLAGNYRAPGGAFGLQAPVRDAQRRYLQHARDVRGAG